ncbi:unnamed protein product, partial [Heligmosomoides polygyrus]|uniref:Chondroitin proteoglycan 2 n=1 Tax=Heligmosomoides polygyrus TaxID=6339 RepID=A0A183GPG4_HELPZ
MDLALENVCGRESNTPGKSPVWKSSFCALRKDGFYAEKCSSDFIYCEQGRCPSNLLFDEKKGYCDYPEEQCTEARAPSEKPLPIDCKGKEDGYYSRGCTTNFVFCMNGVASLMTCPPSLVFNKNKGYCDYMESCSEPPASLHTHVASPAVPVPLAPAPASTVVPQSPVVDCKGEKNGYHSKGCTADFIYCADGIASPMTCPPLLVFNEKKGYCDYVENCSATPAPAPASRPIAPVPIPAPPAPVHAQPPIGPECTGRPSGFYAKGCTSEFVYCEEGMAVLMKCPSSLVFNAEKNYCDYPENCSGGEIVQEKAVQTSSVATLAETSGRSICPKPNGTFSKGCSSEFFICSYGVAQLMICPGELVFNVAEGYCDHKEYCQDRHAAMVDSDRVYDTILAGSSVKKATEAVVSSECAHLPDGRYGSLCDSKFIMCSSGVTFFMECPNHLLFDPRLSSCVYATECRTHPLPQSTSNVIVPSSDAHLPARGVFVEGVGACDAPSACSQKPKHATSGPVSYQATMASDKPESPDCDTDGYFSQPCASDYYNCVGGKKFAGKCPSGLVFNMEKIYCDYPENCMLGENVKSPEAQPVPTTVIRKDDSCQGRSDGVVIDDDCQTEFTTCLSSVAYVSRCPARLVYSVKAKLCDYPEACRNNADDSSSSEAYHQALTSEGVGAISISATYQHSSVGATLCKDKRDGPLSSFDCRPSFSFCVNGALYSTICPEGLLCESLSECGSVGDVGTTPKPISYITATPVRSPSGDSVVVPMVDEFDCSLRANGKYSLGCVGRFVMCSSGRAYVRSCPSGLVYNEAKGLCDYECSPSDGSLDDVAQGVHIRPRQKTMKAYSFETPKAIDNTPEQIECVMSVALGRCSSRFWRCMDGRLESAQCPGQSLFDETLSLCVYDLPDCMADTTTTTTVTTTVGISAAPPPIMSTQAAYTSEPVYSPQINYGYIAALSNAQYYPSQNMDNPFGVRYPAYVPLPFEDFMHGKDKVNHGPIKFEPRSAVSDDTRSKLMDVFDGVKSPWLFPGVNRIFIPYHHYHHRHGDTRSAERRGDVITSKLFDVLNPEVPVPLEAAAELEAVIATESQHEDQDAGHENMVHGDENVQQDVQEESVVERNEDPNAHHENLKEGHLKDVLREDEETVRGEEKDEHETERNEDTEETSVDEQHEGSGQERITRRRRSPSMRTPKDFSVCTTLQSPGLVSIGFCRQDFIFCRAAGSGVMAACPIGDLFDSSTNKCVASERCGEPEIAPLPAAREAVSAIAAQKYTPGTAQSVHVFSPHDVPITTTTNAPPIIYPSLSTTMKDPVVYPPGLPVVYPPPLVAAQDSNSVCLHDTDFAADCSGNFMKCVHGVAYPMKCPAGLVFSQATHYCDYPAAVPACAGMQIKQPPRTESFQIEGIYVPTQPPAQHQP